ncbi:MAG TPA: CoA transferase [Gemmatimonadaceae bacterium]|nr:CoA transferase [Gemmatimonadaceae bacterium]
MPGPLAGVRVVDVSAVMAGPFSTMILAEQGADVIKIEPLNGDVFRADHTHGHEMSAMAFNSNRAKRSIALNLKDPRGLEIAERLIERADVFVENFRTGVADRLGLGYEKLSASNPRLVYVRASGMGSRGPEAGERVYDPIIQAKVGLSHFHRDAAGPQLVSVLIADKVAPTLISQAITAALYERSVSGRGQYIEQSMLHAVLWWMWPEMMVTHTYRADDDMEEQPLYYGPPMVYAATDGHVVVVAGDDQAWHALCAAVDRLDLVEDQRFASLAGRIENKDEFGEIFAKEFAKASVATWKNRLSDADASGTVINTLRDALSDAQIRANDMITTIESDAFGQVRVPTPAAHFSRTPAEAGVSPRLGEHTEDILTELDYSHDERSTLLADDVVRQFQARHRQDKRSDITPARA